MIAKFTSTPGVENGNRMAVGGLFLTRIYDRYTDEFVRTDIANVYKQLPSLWRAFESAILHLDCTRQLPLGVTLEFSQVEHLASHAIGVVAFLERSSPIVDTNAFEDLARQLGTRIYQLFSAVLIQRANGGSTDKIPLADENPVETRRFFAAFDTNFSQAADISNWSPQTNSGLDSIRIIASERLKSEGQSGPIVERICSIDRIDATSAIATNVGNKKKFEIQFSDGIEAYALQLVKASKELVQIKLAPTTFPKRDKEIQKFLLIEITAVKLAPWRDIAKIFGKAADLLARLPTPEEHRESESLFAKVANSESHTVASKSEQSNAVKHPKSTRRQNRRVQEPL